MKKLIFLMITSFSLAGCSASELEKVTIALDYAPNTNHTGLYVAQNQGFYEKLGIELEILQLSESSTEALVASGTVDFGVSYSENILMVPSEMELVSIMTIMSQNTSGIASYVDRNIKRPKDLEYKTYCGWGTEVEEAMIKEIVQQDGGNWELVNFEMSSTSLLNSKNSDCDVFWEFEGVGVISAELNNIEIDYFSLVDYGLDWYTPIIITTSKMIEEENELVSKFVEATIEGYQYAYENPNAASAILVEAVPELDSEFITKSQEFVSNKYVDENGEIGFQSNLIWDNFINWMVNAKIVEPPESKVYTNEFIK